MLQRRALTLGPRATSRRRLSGSLRLAATVRLWPAPNRGVAGRVSWVIGQHHGALALAVDQGPPVVSVEVVVAAADRVELVEPGVAGAGELGSDALVVGARSRRRARCGNGVGGGKDRRHEG